MTYICENRWEMRRLHTGRKTYQSYCIFYNYKNDILCIFASRNRPDAGGVRPGLPGTERYAGLSRDVCGKVRLLIVALCSSLKIPDF